MCKRHLQPTGARSKTAGEARPAPTLGPGLPGRAPAHALDEMAEGFATLDWEYRATYGNRAGLAFFGLRLEEVLGRTFWDIFPATRSMPVGEAVRRAMELGISSIEEFVSPTARRWIEIRVYPTSSGASLYVRDIEERKRKELQRDEFLRALEETRFRLEEAQRIAHVGSFEYLADSRTTVWSDEELRIYGLEPGLPSPTYEVMLERFIHPEDAPVLDETFGRALESGSVFELEHRIVRPDGEVRWVYDRAHPYVDEQGRLMRYVGATLDVTDHKGGRDPAAGAGEDPLAAGRGHRRLDRARPRGGGAPRAGRSARPTAPQGRRRAALRGSGTPPRSGVRNPPGEPGSAA